MRALVVVALFALLVGCGAESPPKTQARVGVKASCDRVASALRGVDSYKPSDISTFSDALNSIIESGTQATREALQPLVGPVTKLSTALDLDEHQRFLAALDDLALVCKGAGSSALQ